MVAQPAFHCTACGAAHAKWAGRCDECGAWNAITEDDAPGPGVPRGRVIALSDLGALPELPPQVPSGVAELDRVLGGGLVAGSAVLLGGDPGIGKSTLLLQAAARFARGGLATIYVTGEESAAQVQMRASRLNLGASPLRLAAETSLRDILATIEAEAPDLVVIDSIQTMWLDSLDSAPGSVTQVRAAAHELTTLAKRKGTAVILVGHVTKDGSIAGPRTVEHMVDTVLYFEGDPGHQFRILRAVKNRFGPSGEIGVFEMTGRGLVEVKNPSSLFLSERARRTPGAVVFAGVEGTRAVLCEIQALVAAAPSGQARRSVVGWDGGRLAMILAVLDARAGLGFAGMDVYLNVAGGLRIGEPAADLAVALALVSAQSGVALDPECVIFGEIGLSGALRPVAQTEIRLKEARKLGFTGAILPVRPQRARRRDADGDDTGDMALREFADLPAVVTALFGPDGQGSNRV
ncbi:MAG: DNA repair protein RadA [Rubellimicrobium sp.]|nr:DNA repair protein RadA [Rubellimicrobium sp.]